jgi:hypothetical protein
MPLSYDALPPGVGELPTIVGKYYFVHSGTGSNGNSGTHARPLATVDAAINKCIAGRDGVAVLPGHAETIGNNATSLVPDVAGIAIVGLGWGSARPTLTFSGTASKIVISGAGTLFKNFLITSTGTIDIVLGVHVTGADSVLEDVEIREASTTSQFVLPLHVAAAGVKVLRYKFYGAAGDATVTGLRMSGADRLEVAHSMIIGNFQGSADATGAIQSLTTANLDINIHHNFVANRDGTSEAGIVFVATDTGFVGENFISVPTGDFGQGLIADTAMDQFNNYVVDVDAERGAPEGTASA